MLSRIRVEVRARSMEAAEREAEILLDHIRTAGYLEGIVPAASKLTDHHFGRALGDADGWDSFNMGYEGRVIHTFEPEEEKHGGLKQYGHLVMHFDDQLAEQDDTGRGDDVTIDRMVLERRYPVTREHSWETGGGLIGESVELVDAKRLPPLTAEEMAAFSELTMRPEVQEIAFGPAKRRDGYEVDLTACSPPPLDLKVGSGPSTVTVTGGPSSSAMIRDTFFGETFGDAVAAASAAVDRLAGVQQ